MGFLQAQTQCEFQPRSPLRACFLAPQAWDSPAGLERGSSAGSSEGDGPKNGARLMVPTASSGESSSWQEGRFTL